MNLECEHGQLARSCNICEYEREIAELNARVKELEAENKRLREALDLVISFIPDGWGMPLGFNQVAQQAREAMREASHESK